MTIKELIAHLGTFPPDLSVGRVGHYGEFHPMDAYDFGTRMTYETPDGNWKNPVQVHKEVLAIYPPYIGNDPD